MSAGPRRQVGRGFIPGIQPKSASRASAPEVTSLDAPAQAAPEQTPLSQLVTAYLAVLANERASSPHTIRAYDRELNNFASHIAKTQGADTPPSAIEHTHIRAWLGTLYDRGLSKASAARALAAVRSWFRWLARFGHVTQNAASLVATPKLPKH